MAILAGASGTQPSALPLVMGSAVNKLTASPLKSRMSGSQACDPVMTSELDDLISVLAQIRVNLTTDLSLIRHVLAELVVAVDGISSSIIEK